MVFTLHTDIVFYICVESSGTVLKRSHFNAPSESPSFQRSNPPSQASGLMANRVHGETLKLFREELYGESILHDGIAFLTRTFTILFFPTVPKHPSQNNGIQRWAEQTTKKVQKPPE